MSGDGGRRVLVSGAASGIGEAIARRFGAAGDRVAGLDRDSERLALAPVECAFGCDVASEREVDAAVAAAVASLGGLDVVVCCAGVASRGAVTEIDAAEWDRVFAVNARGVFLVCRAAISHLRASGGGAIVNVASQLGLVGAARSAAYCASKGAVVQLTRAMALDHAADGISVNAVCPGPTTTPLLERYFADAADPVAELEAYRATMAIGRILEPAEVAAAVAYLAGPEARGVTGIALPVDGGYVAG